MAPDVERDDDAAREAAAAAIARTARAVRRAAPRSLWIAAIVVGGIAAIGFAVAMMSEGAPVTRTAPRVAEHSGLWSGLLIGAAIGFVIGYALGRQRLSHSSRNNP